jgi:hypothetical protein
LGLGLGWDAFAGYTSSYGEDEDEKRRFRD